MMNISSAKDTYLAHIFCCMFSIPFELSALFQFFPWSTSLGVHASLLVLYTPYPADASGCKQMLFLVCPSFIVIPHLYHGALYKCWKNVKNISEETEKEGIGTTQQHLTIVETGGAVASRSS